jgi:hypothetical protein
MAVKISGAFRLFGPPISYIHASIHQVVLPPLSIGKASAALLSPISSKQWILA